jgi:Bacterial alpha-L-rhamnosidase 6 hairpin glycosidase domain
MHPRAPCRQRESARRTALTAIVGSVALLRCGGAPTLPSPPDASPSPAPSACASRTEYETGDAALDALQRHFRPVLEANEKAFTGRTGAVRGFGAGSIYPQVWLRDSATIIPATRYLYPPAFLTSWLEEHVSHQSPDGALWDWIAAGEPAQFTTDAPRATRVYSAGGVILSADKNTTVADQEASAVDAAWRVFDLTGDRDWLLKPIGGRALVDRLDDALGYVERQRFDAGLGLVASAFTADWGDVSPAYADQRAIYLDESTPVVVGLYANAFFARAAEELAALLDAAANPERAQHWREVAASVRAAIDRHLWNESGGFYRLHRVVVARGAAGLFDDSDVFALGGNTVAALYGPADDARAGRIFAVADARRAGLGLSSAAAVLMPAYPTGFFIHPILRDAYTYQNGGQWDWWSGRFLLALYKRGYSQAATEGLRAAARRAAGAGGLFEWHARDGAGQGSHHYAGSAGALSAAIYEGLFGLASNAGGLDVSVRLGNAGGSVTVCEPASGRELRYVYEYAPEQRRATLRYSSNAPGRGRLALRLPEPAAPATLLIDGQPTEFLIERIGEDEYVSLTTDWASHRLELQLR